MIYFLRMSIAVVFGVIGAFFLLSAIEFHRGVNASYHDRYERSELTTELDNHPVALKTADEYYRSMLGTIGVRYGTAGFYLLLSAASFCGIRDGRIRFPKNVARVYGPEDK